MSREQKNMTDSTVSGQRPDGMAESVDSSGLMALEDLLQGISFQLLTPCNSHEIMIAGVTADSRQVVPGALFVAITGGQSDGHRYLDAVFSAGCTAVLVESGRCPDLSDLPPDCCVVEVADSRQAYGRLAANRYGHPARALCLVGITGTNGKTTVTYLLESILTQAGQRVGVIGTVSYRYRNQLGQMIETPAPYTTPEPLLLQGLLHEMRAAGVETVLMEVSSHALAQQRLGDLLFDVAAFTNLSRDHLDYHLNMDEYFAAKRLLFTRHLKQGAQAILTRSVCPAVDEGKWVQTLCDDVARSGGRVLQCGRPGESDIYPLAVNADVVGTAIELRCPWGKLQLSSPLAGDFNVSNLQTALGIGHALGVDAQKMAEALATCHGAPGRLERIAVPAILASQRPAVFVDYAHTPDALEQVLITLAKLPHQRLGLVFGCGGDRDRGKRHLMGQVAAQRADWVIVTDDNPRSEDPPAIVSEIRTGLEAAGMVVLDGEGSHMPDQGYRVIHDRVRAIEEAISLAGPEDIVLVAGKGHEQMQLTGAVSRYFDDREQARDAIQAWTPDLVCQATGGKLVGASTARHLLAGVSTDSRNLEEGAIFVALIGDRFDGHDYLAQAAQQRAGCLVIQQSRQHLVPAGVPTVLVDDTQRALGDLASFRRKHLVDLPGPVIGLTGSCGKTSVKEMVAAIFARHWPRLPAGAPDPVLKTQGNFNNLIGLPLSLLPLKSGHKAAVLEMGMNRPGEISRLAEIAAADIVCITNIHGAHLEGLGSIENVARAKEELFAASGPDTVLAVNLDDPLVRACSTRYRQKKISYAVSDEGLRYNPQISASDVGSDGPGRVTFTLHVLDQNCPVTLAAPGMHNVSNAIAAAAIAHAAGIGVAEIAAGLADFRPIDKRMQILTGRLGLMLINDCYNANPASMAAALITLAEQDAPLRLAVLGDMLEMGSASGECHLALGRQAAELGLDFLALIGDFASQTAAGALSAGMAESQILIATDQEQVLAWLEALAFGGGLAPGSWLLIKGSRGMRLETLVDKLLP